MNVRACLAGLLLLASPSAVVASTPDCLPKVEKAWIRAAPPGATSLAGYAIVRNDCPRAVSLGGIKGRDFVMAMVHFTRMENGVSRMRHAKSTPIPARGLVRFEPGGRHFMLMHPKRKLPEGAIARLELRLADGRRIPVDFAVRREPPR